jgi:threonine 3-dehydrogenase
MKALRKLRAAPGLDLVEVEAPTYGPHDVLIRVKKSAICGTDVHIYNWDDWAARTIPVPLTIGHEFVGTLAALGAEVEGLTLGQRVSAEGHISCGRCRNCRSGRAHICAATVGLGVQRPGCFAEYVALPAKNVFPVPESIPDRVAAFLDPLGNAVHTALSFDLAGEDVLVTGAGPIGVMAVAIARHVGARRVVVTDVNDVRLALARRVGADRAINVTRDDPASVFPDLAIHEGFDVVLEMSGKPEAIAQALATARPGARFALLGIASGPLELPWNTVVLKGLQLKGIYGREVFETWYKMTALLESGLDVTPVITHELPYTAYEEGFAAMRSGTSGKVVLDWQGA